MSKLIEEENAISGERKRLSVLAGGGGGGVPPVHAGGGDSEIPRNPHLAAMLKQGREPVNYQIVKAKVDAKLMAQEANEAKAARHRAGEIVSNIGPFLTHMNKERDYGWGEEY